LSVERTAEAMSSMLGADVSTGFVASLATEAAGGLDGFIDEVRRGLQGSDVVHADETTDQVKTKRWWLHVASNHLYTYLVASSTRAKSAPDEAGVLGAFTGVMMHDRLSMYFKYDQAAHAICHAHVVRDLAAIGVGWDQGWANDMAALLTEMNNAAHAARDAGRTKLSKCQVKNFLSRYDTIVEAGLAVNPAPVGRQRDALEKKSFNLATSLKKRRPEATRFVTDLRVPFTNNEAERSLRMAKIHKKISGCFQSGDNACNYAKVRSYLGTARKHGVGSLDVLAQLFNGEAWMPPRTT